MHKLERLLLRGVGPTGDANVGIIVGVFSGLAFNGIIVFLGSSWVLMLLSRVGVLAILYASVGFS